MDKTRSTSNENKTYWENHLQQLGASGLSRKKYCDEHNLNYARFHYWIKKLSASKAEKLIAVKLLSHESTNTTPLCTLHFKNAMTLAIYHIDVIDFIFAKIN